MKKAIAIIVLGLLLSGCGAHVSNRAQQSYIQSDVIKIGMEFSEFRKLFNRTRLGWMELNIHNTYPKYMHSMNSGYISSYAPNHISYGFESNSPAGDGLLGYLKGYKLTKIFNNNLEAIEYYLSLKPTSQEVKVNLIRWRAEQGGNIAEKKKPKKKEPKKQTPDKEPKKNTKPKPDDKLLAASMGSGFFVTRAGHLVTNYHVIEECNAVKTNILGKEVRTDIIAIDKTNDLAIIKAEMNPSKVFPVSNKDVSLLQDVIVAGFPLGKSVSAIIKTHKGSVTALAGFGDNYSNFQTDATINQGNSGGPIITQKGNVVGVAVQLIAAEHAQNVFFGVKSSTLRTFANANSINFLPPNNREMSNEDLGQLITEATVFLECWMTVAKIKHMIAQEENRKAFYSEHK